MIAFAFLQQRRLEQAGRGKKRPLTTAPAEPASRPERHHRSPYATAPAKQMPALPTMDQLAA
jgi:hypothetical protein